LFLQLGARAQNNTWWQWSTRNRCFSTNLGSPHGPKKAELVVLVQIAPESRRLPTAIGGGVPGNEEPCLVLDGRHLVKDGQHVKHNDRGAGWRSMVGNNITPHAHLVTLAWSSERRWWLCVEPTRRWVVAVCIDHHHSIGHFIKKRPWRDYSPQWQLVVKNRGCKPL